MNKIHFFSALGVVVCMFALSLNANAQNNKKNMYVYKGSTVVYKASTSLVDSVALEENKTVVTLYKRDGSKLYSAPYADIDSITYSMLPPVADLLDVKFTEDGQAYDASQMEIDVKVIAPEDKLDVKYNELYQTYEAHFDNTWSGTPTSYCKVDYSMNDYFKERMADGHTLETLFKTSYTPPIANSEAKWFGAHEGGGTGFLITTTSGARQNELTFLPHTGGNYRWATSGIVPQPEVYYHLVGVWNKEEEKAYIYVNGELKNVVDAPGDFKFPANMAAQWVGIGCDANTSNGAQSGNWTIVRERIYDKALDQYEAEALWEEIADKTETPKADVLDVVFKADGTAEDVSPMKNTVETISPENAVPTYYNGNYDSYAAKIKNNWGTGGSLGDAPTYFKVDYAENQAFKDALADGHTLETIFKATYTEPINNAEAKWFASHQAGGTGFLISKQSGERQNEITFLPNVSTTGKSNWIWATSGIVPAPETYYHVVGVWNKEEGKAYVYINGELKNTVDAEGELKFPSNGANWFGIGCDANTSNGENGGNWEIVRARIYDEPLSTHSVAALWNEVTAQTKAANDSVAKAIEEEQIPIVEAPKADLLDVVFKADGTAEDVSPMQNEVITNAGDGLTTYYNNTYGRYVARFDNTWGGAATGWYRINYGTSEAFSSAIADGHTLEAVFMGDYEGEILKKEAKFFSAHQGGGTGLMLASDAQMTFLPHTSGSYRWAKSGMIPESKKYYHMVGVWNQEEGKAYVYINGELRGTADAPGSYTFPIEAAQWFAIGGDAQNSICEQAWTGDVVLARVYNDPLDISQVKALWRQVEELQEKAPELVSGISYYDNLQVLAGGSYNIKGTGFKDGDQITLTALSSENTSATLGTTLTADGVSITLPADFQSGRYLLSIKRGEQVQDVTPVRINVVEALNAGAKVIAHRGYWNTTGSAQNSRSSVQNAIDNNFYGAEIDVWLTTDGHLMVNHDATLNGVEIQSSTYDECKDLKLSNGETIPELKDILALFEGEDVKTKLIIEIKSHSTAERSEEAAEAAANAVWEAFAGDKVEYISFSLDACKKLASIDDTYTVGYLNGDKSPQELSELGIKALDYTLSTYKNNPTWVEEAHSLGMLTNVWTLNTSADMIEANNLGIDFITTDYPLDAEKIRKLYSSEEE